MPNAYEVDTAALLTSMTPDEQAFYSAYRARLVLAADVGDAREAAALTTRELARKAGVPVEDVERIERGEFGWENMPLVAALAEALGLLIRLEAAVPA
jgi:DNA-binding XRE family transcriptional regulator